MTAKKKKKLSVFEKNKDEIKWNVINSLIAGALVLFGSFTATSNLTLNGLLAAIASSLIIALTKFFEYWKTQEKEYSKSTNSKSIKLFNFIN